ncbi:hypothetical protein GGQ84_000913 [Desulfitispora alkaliphila]|uniref:pyruvate kinase alpha/beta domain-containing protein n=1 Tax=Desulfitispora alkaliphila TaxID=622674 RepID=UPI003D1EB11D
MLFENKGPENTDQVIEAVLKRAKELNIKHVVLATKTGDTAKKLLGHDLDITCVTYHVGFKNPGEDLLPLENRKELEKLGMKVLTTTHLFAGLDRAVKNKFSGIYPAELMAHTLRMFGQGTKVSIEVAGMALDAGLIPYGEDVIALAGSGRGADTAIVIRPSHSNNFFDTKIREIICKPREF